MASLEAAVAVKVGELFTDRKDLEFLVILIQSSGLDWQVDYEPVIGSDN